MTIKEAIEQINYHRVEMEDKKVLLLLDKWNELLFETTAFDYSDNELDILHKELDVQMIRLRNKDLSAQIIKNSLQSFIQFLKEQLKSSYSYLFLTIGSFAGMALSFFAHFNVFFGFLIGTGTGLLIDQYLNKKQRVIKTSLNDTW